MSSAKYNTAEVIPFPKTKEEIIPPLVEVFIVFSVDSKNDRRIGRVEGTFSTLEFADEYINSRDPEYLISYEVEKHTLDYQRWYE